MKDAECNLRKDPVDRLVRDLTAEEMVDWLIEYKGLPEHSRENTIANLQEQFNWHRLRGRLDRIPTLLVLADLILFRRKEKHDNNKV